jgi:hypothetical protein
MVIRPDEAQSPRLHRWYRSFLDKPGRCNFQLEPSLPLRGMLGLPCEKSNMILKSGSVFQFIAPKEIF